jgi:hypothetical protein
MSKLRIKVARQRQTCRVLFCEDDGNLMDLERSKLDERDFQICAPHLGYFEEFIGRGHEGIEAVDGRF